MKISNSVNKLVDWLKGLVVIAGFIILGIFIFQTLEFSNTNPHTELRLSSGHMSKYKMMSCIIQVMNYEDELTLKEYEKSMKLCTDNHVKKEQFKDKLKNFSKGNNSTYLNVDFDDLKNSENAVAEMLKKLKTKTKKEK